MLPFDLHPLIAEAKRRARRRRLLIAAAVLAAAGTGLAAVLATGAGGSPNEVPWLPTRPQLGPTNPPLAPACTAAQLHATLSLQGATSAGLEGGISIVNRSPRACSLVGRPKLSFAGATAKWRMAHWSGTPFRVFDPLALSPGSLRAVAPGRHVAVGVFWSNWCGRGSSTRDGRDGRPPTAIVLRAPGGGEIALQNRIGGHPGIAAPVCLSRGPSTLAATRFTPFVPQGGPSSALPLRARIVSGAQIVIEGKTITQPGFVARPGTWHAFTVVLTNRSRRPFRFGRTCPAYVEGFSGPQDRAYVLNCHAVGAIGPGRAVSFAMRIYVPRNLGTHAGAFGWTLAPHTWNAPQALAIVQMAR